MFPFTSCVTMKYLIIIGKIQWDGDHFFYWIQMIPFYARFDVYLWKCYWTYKVIIYEM